MNSPDPQLSLNESFDLLLKEISILEPMHKSLISYEHLNQIKLDINSNELNPVTNTIYIEIMENIIRLLLKELKNVTSQDAIDNIRNLLQLLYSQTNLNKKNKENLAINNEENKLLSNKINKLDSENKKYIHKLSDLNIRYREREHEIDRLRADNEVFAKKLNESDDLIIKLNEFNNETKTLKERLKEEISKNNTMHGKNIELTEQIYELENAPTSQVYNRASQKYNNLALSYRISFIIGLLILLITSILSVIYKQSIISYLTIESDLPNNSLIEFWIIKVSIVLIFITLISYFLKQSSHYQKLSDQNHQTQLELQAYPTFMNTVPPEQAIEIRKELALKYFGREIDSSAHKDMSNLISDQMKNTTELVKASTNAFKSLTIKHQGPS